MKSFSFDALNRKQYNSTDAKTYKYFSLDDENWWGIWDEDGTPTEHIDTLYPMPQKIYLSCAWTAYNKRVFKSYKMSAKHFKKIASFGKIPGVLHKNW